MKWKWSGEKHITHRWGGKNYSFGGIRGYVWFQWPAVLKEQHPLVVFRLSGRFSRNFLHLNLATLGICTNWSWSRSNWRGSGGTPDKKFTLIHVGLKPHLAILNKTIFYEKFRDVQSKSSQPQT